MYPLPLHVRQNTLPLPLHTRHSFAGLPALPSGSRPAGRPVGASLLRFILPLPPHAKQTIPPLPPQSGHTLGSPCVADVAEAG